METDLIGMIRVLSAPVLMRVVLDHQVFQPFFLETILRREAVQTVTLLIRALVSPRYQSTLWTHIFRFFT